MKTIPLPCLIVWLALVAGFAHAQGVLTDGLVAYYPLNGNAADSSGNGYDGTPIAVTYGFDRFGAPTRAATFDGISSNISLYGLTNANLFPLTLSVWINGLPTFGSDYGVICKYALASANGFGVFATLDYVHSFYFGSAGSVYDTNGGMQDLSTLDGNWHQMVVTYDTVGGVIYKDGIPMDSVAWDGLASAPTSPEPILIGLYATPTRTITRFFNGSLDDVRIYSRALSSNEVAQLYTVESTAAARTPVASATLDNGFVVAVNVSDRGYGYTNTPQVRFIGGGGNGAQAVALVSNRVVLGIIVTNAGFGYTSTPLVVIDPPFIPNPVLGIAPMSFLSFSNLAIGGTYQLQMFNAYYWTNQTLSLTATSSVYTQLFAGIIGSGVYRLALNPVPAQAFATPQLVNGFVVGATVTSGGSGYVTSPTVRFVGGGGTNATATAQITGGVVTHITITSAGIGYTNPPSLQIAPPPAAAIFPTVQPVMRLDSSNLAPYDNYQIQSATTLGPPWTNWPGGMFVPDGPTNSQFLFVTNATGFFRLKYTP